MLNRLKRAVYYCRRIQPGEEGYLDGISLFRPPELRIINLLPVGGETILASGGELSEHYLKARLPTKSQDQYYERDLIFVYLPAPKSFDPADPGADYTVKSVLPGHGVTELILQELVQGVKNPGEGEV